MLIPGNTGLAILHDWAQLVYCRCLPDKGRLRFQASNPIRAWAIFRMSVPSLDVVVPEQLVQQSDISWLYSQLQWRQYSLGAPSESLLLSASINIGHRGSHNKRGKDYAPVALLPPTL